MADDLRRRIAERSDEDLYEMLYVHRDDWTPEALELAAEIWTERDLSAEKLAHVEQVGEQRASAREAQATEPLGRGPRVLFFLFNFSICLGIPTLIVAHSLYRSDGYDQKFEDALSSMIYGTLCFILIYLLGRGLLFVIAGGN